MILRANPVAFGSWGLTCLTSQLHDTNQSILIETASVLDEALEDRVRCFDSKSIRIAFVFARD